MLSLGTCTCDSGREVAEKGEAGTRKHSKTCLLPLALFEKRMSITTCMHVWASDARNSISSLSL